ANHHLFSLHAASSEGKALFLHSAGSTTAGYVRLFCPYVFAAANTSWTLVGRSGNVFMAAVQFAAIERSLFASQSLVATARAASSMSLGSTIPSPSASIAYERQVAGRNCIGPTAWSQARSLSSAPASVSATLARPPLPSSAGPMIGGSARPSLPS